MRTLSRWVPFTMLSLHGKGLRTVRPQKQSSLLTTGPRPTQPPRPAFTRKFMRYEDLVEAAHKEERIFHRQPTPINWCISCQATRCKEGCSSYENEAMILRGNTPKAATIEKGYSSSETVRARTREVLYSPALQEAVKKRNAAIQTRKSRGRDKSTQTEAEAFPLPGKPLLRAKSLVYLVLFLFVTNLALALIAATPGAYARPTLADERWVLKWD